MVQLSHPYMTTEKNVALTIWTFVSKVMSLLFNMLSRFAMGGFPRGSAGEESTCNAGDPVRSLGWENPLEKGKATHSFSGLEKSMDYIVHGVAKSQTQLSDLKKQTNNHFMVTNLITQMK